MYMPVIQFSINKCIGVWIILKNEKELYAVFAKLHHPIKSKIQCYERREAYLRK